MRSQAGPSAFNTATTGRSGGTLRLRRLRWRRYGIPTFVRNLYMSTATTADPSAGDQVDLSTLSATLGGDTQSRKEQITFALFIVVPVLAVAVAIPVAWGGWLGWSDVLLFFVFYALTGHGITVGYHRLFTHKSYKPNRAVKIIFAIAGSMAIQGP